MNTHDTVPDRGPRRPLALTPAGIIGTLLLAAVVLVFLRLGFWQLARLAEQRELNTGVAARLAAPAIANPAALQDTTGLFYRVLAARGTYDNERSIILPGRSRRGLPGVYLLSPLRLAGRTDAVLVNRGWVPSADAVTIEVTDFAVTDTVTVNGLVLPFPGRSESLSLRDTASGTAFRRVWFTIDEQALRAQFPYSLLPATLQLLPAAAEAGAVAASGIDRYPAPLDPPPLDEGPHLGYALQWFSFALIGIIGWFALMMRARAPARAAPPVMALLLFGLAAVLPSPASAQLRPLEGMEWRVFDDGVLIVASGGAGVLWSQPAPLTGTAGRLIEAGNYLLAVRSDRMAVELRGTVIWRLREDTQIGTPWEGVRPTEDGIRQDVGTASAATVVRLSPSGWPADVMLRFGATIPTTSDESGLDRDRTDFFALVGARYRRGPLTLTMENGVGINGTVHQEYPQSDVWTYAFGAAWDHGPLSAVGSVVGRQDGHSWIVHGNEDTRELRVGVDIGTRRWLSARYIRGLSDFSPEHGLRLSAGFTIRR